MIDTGSGISKEKLPGLFNREFGADEGHGNGLIIVKTIVERSGGAVKAFSRGLRQGSDFTFSMKMREMGAPLRSEASTTARVGSNLLESLVGSNLDDNSEVSSD